MGPFRSLFVSPGSFPPPGLCMYLSFCLELFSFSPSPTQLSSSSSVPSSGKPSFQVNSCWRHPCLLHSYKFVFASRLINVHLSVVLLEGRQWVCLVHHCILSASHTAWHTVGHTVNKYIANDLCTGGRPRAPGRRPCGPSCLFVCLCLTLPSSLPGGVLTLLEHEEEYVFTLPSAYARSILTIPWVELGGKVSISCAKTGYSATVTFHTKPFYGGKVHR